MSDPTNNLDSVQKLDVQIALLTEKIQNLTKVLDQNISDMKANYVTKEQFSPVQKVVYGLVSTILITVIAGVLALVIKG